MAAPLIYHGPGPWPTGKVDRPGPSQLDAGRFQKGFLHTDTERHGESPKNQFRQNENSENSQRREVTPRKAKCQDCPGVCVWATSGVYVMG